METSSLKMHCYSTVHVHTCLNCTDVHVHVHVYMYNVVYITSTVCTTQVHVYLCSPDSLPHTSV